MSRRRERLFWQSLSYLDCEDLITLFAIGSFVATIGVWALMIGVRP